MNYSEHYNLNLVEGTDLFNPLTNDVPNYEAIDAAMYNNKVRGIGTATELLSGTVHALTRADSDTNVFRFVATANYTAGDTFTVDGVQVTALMTDGTALASNAYVINANVLCCLVGTVLTLYVSPGTMETANNALRLGGQLPEYYGTADDVASATAVANAASTLATYVNTKLSSLTQGILTAGQTSITLTNSSITTASIIEVFVDVEAGVASEPINYKTITVTAGTVVLTFDAQENDITVGIRVA